MPVKVTARAGNGSSSRYLEIYTKSGEYIDRHLTIIECSETLSELPSGEYEIRQPRLDVIKTNAVVNSPIRPQPVTGITVGAITNTTVELSWDATTGAQDYTIHQSTDNVNFIEVSTLALTTTTITGLSQSTNYYFSVTVRVPSFPEDSVRPTAALATTTGALAAPTGLVLSNQQPNTINVDWNANTEPNVASYNLYKSIASATSGFTLHVTTIHPDTDFIDTFFDENTQSWYKVTAVDSQSTEGPESSVVSAGGGSIPTTNETSVTKSGITWTFDQAYPVGQFVTGDYFVVGPITITSISPLPSSGRNGTMVDPALTIGTPTNPQGYDSRIFPSSITYSDSANVGLSLPTTIGATSSVCSSVSNSSSQPFGGIGSIPADSGAQALSEIQILTVVSEAPVVGSFRPFYRAGDKTMSASWLEGSIDYSALSNLTPSSGARSIADYATYYSNPIIESAGWWINGQMKPSNQYSYGREVAITSATAGLLLNCNYTNAQKRDLLIGLVQHGLDTYMTIRAGGGWGQDGGHHQGRKLPAMIAGAVFNDTSIWTACAAGASTRWTGSFQEDSAHFYTNSDDVANKGYPSTGIAEWSSSSNPTTEPRSAWNVTYRDINYAPGGPAALCALIMGMDVAWGNQAFFDYHDRARDGASEGWSGKPASVGWSTAWLSDMWDTYRGNY